MREMMLVSTLGLSRNDQMTLASVLKLAAELRDRYRVGNPEDPDADLVFVNADEQSAISGLRSLRKRNQFVTPILVTSGAADMGDEITIRRPMVLKRILGALKDATLLTGHRTSAAEQDSSESQAKKILVVDDSFPVRKYMEQKIPLLYEGRIDLSFAETGEEAMKKVTEESPDLIFLDVVMPGVDGYKVCKWIKSVRPAAHVSMLTGKKSPFNKVRGAMAARSAAASSRASCRQPLPYRNRLSGRRRLAAATRLQGSAHSAAGTDKGSRDNRRRRR